MSYAKRNIDDAWTDWTFGVDLAEGEEDGWDKVQSLAARGYKWIYFGVDIPRDLAVGPYAMLVDEFPLGDLIFTKKLIRPRIMRDAGLVAVDQETLRGSAKRVILHFFDKHGRPIEVRNDQGNVAVIHPATRSGVAWQGSMFDANGPYSHKEGDSEENVLEQLVHDGFTAPAPGAMDALSTGDFYEINC